MRQIITIMVRRCVNSIICISISFIVAVNPFIVLAESLPETVKRLDQESKTLREEVDKLKQLGSSTSVPAQPTVAIILRKGEMWDLARAAEDPILLKIVNTSNYQLTLKVLEFCKFEAISVRIEGSPLKLVNVLKHHIPRDRSGSAVADFEGYLECDRTLLVRRIATIFGGLLPETGSPISAVLKDKERIKIPCNGGAELSWKDPEQLSITYSVVPFIKRPWEIFDSKTLSNEEIHAVIERTSCSATFLRIN